MANPTLHPVPDEGVVDASPGAASARRVPPLRQGGGAVQVVVVARRPALGAGRSGERLARRRPGDPAGDSPGPAPPPPVELLPPVAYHAETSPEPVPSFTAAPVHVQP